MGNIGLGIGRNRNQNQEKFTYNPDLEYTQQGLANEMYGPGSPIGSYGMSGGQYVSGQATQGFGTGRYGDQGTQYANPNTYGANVYPTGVNPAPSGQGLPGGSYGPGSYGQPGNSAYGNPAAGGSYQFGPGGSAQGYGGYSAMGGANPYQWGQGGASGNMNLTGGAAYGGYGQTYGGFQGLGQQYAQMGSQGVTPQERANLMAASNEAIQSNLGASRDVVANRAAQSGNTAGMLSAQARLGAQAGQQLETADRSNQLAILQENQRRREAGLAGQAGALQGQLGASSGQAGLYGTGAGYMSSLYGQRARLAGLPQQRYQRGAGTTGNFTASYGFGGQ